LRHWPCSFPTFARWQKQELLGSEVLAQGLAYWQQTLAGVPASHSLQTDSVRPDSPSFEGGRVAFRVDAALGRALRAQGEAVHGTLFMVLFASFAGLVSHFSRQAEDVVIGTVCSGRSHPGLDALVGFFVSTVVLRIRVQRNSSFRALVEAARTVVLGALEHAGVPFEQVVDRLRISHGLEQHPIFQIAFFMQPEEPATLALTGIESERMLVPGRMAKFDLTLHAQELRGGDVQCTFEYSRDLFDAGSIERMAKAMLAGLQRAVAHPEVSITAMFGADEPHPRGFSPPYHHEHVLDGFLRQVFLGPDRRPFCHAELR
jgi:non-ribosomal peptide synthetase component F